MNASDKYFPSLGIPYNIIKGIDSLSESEDGKLPWERKLHFYNHLLSRKSILYPILYNRHKLETGLKGTSHADMIRKIVNIHIFNKLKKVKTSLKSFQESFSIKTSSSVLYTCMFFTFVYI